MKRPRGGERGHVLIVTLLAIVLLVSSLSLVAAAVQSKMTEVRLESTSVRLVTLADAALAETIARLAQDPNYRGIRPKAFERGRIASQVRPYDEFSSEITAWASFGGRNRVVRALVRQTVIGPILEEWARIDEETPWPGRFS